jgi:succinyl-CoA synthetase beta subunit
MRLLEFQAKQILRENGIAVPDGCLVSSSDDLNNLKLPVVLKAQVPVGGRGKAGGVKKVDHISDAEQAARDILATTIKGWPVQSLLAEEAVRQTVEHALADVQRRGRNRHRSGCPANTWEN